MSEQILIVTHEKCGHQVRYRWNKELLDAQKLTVERPLCFDCFQIEEDRIRDEYNRHIKRISDISREMMEAACHRELDAQTGEKHYSEKMKEIIAAGKEALERACTDTHKECEEKVIECREENGYAWNLLNNVNSPE